MYIISGQFFPIISEYKDQRRKKVISRTHLENTCSYIKKKQELIRRKTS